MTQPRHKSTKSAAARDLRAGRTECRLLTRRRRKGALLSMELIYLCPIVIGMFFALTEFSLLWTANQRIKTASFVGAREASMPALDPADRIAAAETAVEQILEKDVVVSPNPAGPNDCVIEVTIGTFTGDPVTVEVFMPATVASPDMLQVVGISIADRVLSASTTLRQE